MASEQKSFVVPTKAIQSQADVQKFTQSASYKTMTTFIQALNQSVKGRPISSIKAPSPAVSKMIDIFDKIGQKIDDFPPLEQPMRFGNKAFRTWLEWLRENANEMILSLLPEEKQDALIELVPYFTSAFGDWQRIDFGTGHEHSILCFFICLSELHVFSAADAPNLALHAFPAYLRTTRKLQLVYKLEPAGSHGAWSLDDYCFLPFVFGSAQLLDHPILRPHSIHEMPSVNQYADDFLYFAAVQFACKVKTGSLAEHSPLLNDISGVVSWSKVNQGMIKMYNAEVLTKFPVCQHFLFGSLIPPP